MFIGKNLEDVRKLNGYSRKDIAEKLKITEQAIWQYEVKNSTPEINKIYEMSEIFKTKTNYFFREKQVIFNNNNINKHRIAFRALNKNISNKLLNKQYLQVLYLDNFTDYIFEKVKVPQLSILELVEQINTIRQNECNLSRKKLIKKCANLSRGFLLGETSLNNNLLIAIEKSGVILFEKNIDDKADAFSLWTTNNRPMIILGNNKGVAVRRNFDIAHELCHLLLHTDIEFDMLTNDEYKEIENEAHLFAAEFLMPENEFVNDVNELLKKSNPDSYIPLKQKWFVSIQAMAIRAYNLELITYQQYRYFWMTINKKGYKKREPLDEILQIKRPMKIKSILKLLFDKRVLKLEDMLNELKIEIEFLVDITGINHDFFAQYLESHNDALILDDVILLNEKK